MTFLGPWRAKDTLLSCLKSSDSFISDSIGDQKVLWFGLCSPDNFVLVDSFRLFDELDWNIEESHEQYVGVDWSTYILEEISLAEMECREATREILVLLHSRCSEETEG